MPPERREGVRKGQRRQELHTVQEIGGCTSADTEESVEDRGTVSVVGGCVTIFDCVRRSKAYIRMLWIADGF